MKVRNVFSLVALVITASMLFTCAAKGAWREQLTVGELHGEKAAQFDSSVNVDGVVTADTVVVSTTIDFPSGSIDAGDTALASGKILIGNGAGVASAQTMSGDATIATNGVITVIGYSLIDTNTTTDTTLYTATRVGQLLFGNTASSGRVWRASVVGTNDWDIAFRGTILGAE